jgi:hypothetical protein
MSGIASASRSVGYQQGGPDEKQDQASSFAQTCLALFGAALLFQAGATRASGIACGSEPLEIQFSYSLVTGFDISNITMFNNDECGGTGSTEPFAVNAPGGTLTAPS